MGNRYSTALDPFCAEVWDQGLPRGAVTRTYQLTSRDLLVCAFLRGTTARLQLALPGFGSVKLGVTILRVALSVTVLLPFPLPSSYISRLCLAEVKAVAQRRLRFLTAVCTAAFDRDGLHFAHGLGSHQKASAPSSPPGVRGVTGDNRAGTASFWRMTRPILRQNSPVSGIVAF